MASFLFWMTVIGGGFLIGAIITAGIYFLINSLKLKTMMWQMDRVTKKLQSAEEKQKKFKSSGPAKKIDKKEVEEDARTKRDKFRQFERLRRTAIKEEQSRRNPGKRSVAKKDLDIDRLTELQGRELLQDESHQHPRSNSARARTSDEDFELHRPDDL